jgi:hypothetical protein
VSLVKEVPEHEGDNIDSDKVDEGDEEERRLRWDAGGAHRRPGQEFFVQTGTGTRQAGRWQWKAGVESGRLRWGEARQHRNRFGVGEIVG